jgi:hypothetical protein
MVTLNGNIEIDGVDIAPNIIDCEIRSSWDTLTDTCKVKLPLRLNKIYTREYLTGVKPLFKVGDKATLSLGYDERVVKRFEGFVTEITSNAPIEVTMQDAMWHLKKIKFNYAQKGKSSLSQLCAKMLGGVVPYKVVADYELGPFHTANSTSIAAVLGLLKEKYFIKAFFRDGTLYIGAAIVPSIQKRIELEQVFSHSLIYKKKEDVELQMVGKIHTKDGKAIEVKVGPNGGAVRTFNYNNISEAACKRMLEKELERLRYTGYRGSITTPIDTLVRHGDLVKFPDVFGVEGADHYYLCKGVTTTAGAGGARQVLELEAKE